MKERPILFSAPMVRALVEGRKTQTRRKLRTQPLQVLPMEGELRGKQWIGLISNDPPQGVLFKCKLGLSGDRLWVKETHQIFPSVHDDGGLFCSYRADATPEEEKSAHGHWRPSIYMPRWASRLTLEITDVRVERLHEISADDARAEGVFTPEFGYAQNGPRAPILQYAALWEDINGYGSWDENPFVWVISFRPWEQS